MRKILEQCPSCGGDLVVTALECPHCRTEVRGRYSPCPFCTLTADQLVFVKLFVEKRGNLRDLEKALGVSYPTVRGKLEEIAERLAGAPIPIGEASLPAAEEDARARREVLNLIAEGRISVKEGLARLRGQQAGEEAPSPQE